MIGESFEYENEVLGAVVSIKKGQNRVALWTRTASDEDAQMSIGQQWKSFLGTETFVQYNVCSNH